jgi:hypothetical protein
MYAEFCYDFIPGPLDEGAVLLRVMLEFDFKPNGQERKRCVLLTDGFICEIQNANDYEDIHTRLAALRTTLGDQFNYTLSLRRKGDPIRVRATHNEALKDQIVNG